MEVCWVGGRFHIPMLTLLLWINTPVNLVGFVLWKRRVVCGHIGETDQWVLIRKLEAKTNKWLNSQAKDSEDLVPIKVNRSVPAYATVQCDLLSGAVRVTPVDRQPQPECQHLIEAIRDYFIGRRFDMSDIPVHLAKCSEFARTVLEKCREIPYANTMTYRQVAIGVGRPKAARAVAQALAHNPIPIIIPCHRVIGSDGSLRGFSAPGGVKTKQRLITMERGFLGSASGPVRLS